MARTAKQRAASRKNLEKARRARAKKSPGGTARSAQLSRVSRGIDRRTKSSTKKLTQFSTSKEVRSITDKYNKRKANWSKSVKANISARLTPKSQRSKPNGHNEFANAVRKSQFYRGISSPSAAKKRAYKRKKR